MNDITPASETPFEVVNLPVATVGDEKTCLDECNGDSDFDLLTGESNDDETNESDVTDDVNTWFHIRICVLVSIIGALLFAFSNKQVTEDKYICVAGTNAYEVIEKESELFGYSKTEVETNELEVVWHGSVLEIRRPAQ